MTKDIMLSEEEVKNLECPRCGKPFKEYSFYPTEEGASPAGAFWHTSCPCQEVYYRIFPVKFVVEIYKI